MNNQTTPIKGAVIALLTAKLVAFLGLGAADATVAAAGLWVIISAGVAYVLPHDVETRIADFFRGVTE